MKLTDDIIRRAAMRAYGEAHPQSPALPHQDSKVQKKWWGIARAALSALPFMSTGIAAIAAERKRQIEAEGFTPEHDDEHDAGELSGAASAYALSAACQLSPYTMPLDEVPDAFPHTWSQKWWKPGTAREDLVRAGALIAAEIDRIDREASARPVDDGRDEAMALRSSLAEKSETQSD